MTTFNDILAFVGGGGEIEPCLTGFGEFEPEVPRLISSSIQALYH